jgi:hypothetical protein
MKLARGCTQNNQNVADKSSSDRLEQKPHVSRAFMEL